MNTIFVGGVAAGVVLDIAPDALRIELKSRDIFIKPLESVRPIRESDKVMERDLYDIHPIEIHNLQRGPEVGPPAPMLFGIGVVEHQQLSWGLQELITAYCEKIEAELAKAADA